MTEMWKLRPFLAEHLAVLESVGFLAVVAFAYTMLGLGVENHPPGSCEGCIAVTAGAREWQVWKVVAAAGQAGAIALAVGGAVKVVQFQRDANDDPGVRGTAIVYSFIAVLFLFGVIALIGQIVNEERPWASGLEPMDARLSVPLPPLALYARLPG